MPTRPRTSEPAAVDQARRATVRDEFVRDVLGHDVLGRDVTAAARLEAARCRLARSFADSADGARSITGTARSSGACGHGVSGHGVSGHGVSRAGAAVTVGTAGVAGPGRSVDAASSVGLSFDQAFAEFEAAAARLVAAGVPADAGAILAVRSHLDRLSASVAEAEVRFDTAELWRDEGSGSMRGWLADAAGLGRRAASAQSARLRRLEQWPEVATAWEEGRLREAQVDVIVGVVPRRFAPLFAEQAATVVEALVPLDVAATEFAMRRWVQCAEAADGPEQFRGPANGLHLDRVLDGRFVLNGQFDGAEAAILRAALHDFDVPDPVDAEGNPIGAPRSLAERNADALIAACSFAISHREGASDSGRILPHVSLVVDIDELRASALRGAGVHDHAELERQADTHRWSAAERAWFTDSLDRRLPGDSVTFDGTHLDATATSLLTCDAVIQRVMVAEGKVLDMGREVRTATAAQRRAIITRDRHCRAPGCRTGPQHCDVHHVDHWINGGRTDVHRMVLLCGTHHRLFHRPGHRMELDDDGVFTVHSPRGWSRSTTPEHGGAVLFSPPPT